MFTVRSGNWRRILRIAVVAFLVFSCVRVVYPLLACSPNTSRHHYAQREEKLTRGTVFEVGAETLKVAILSTIRHRNLWLVAAAEDAPLARFQADGLTLQIWPEQQRIFFRRILSPPSDAGH